MYRSDIRKRRNKLGKGCRTEGKTLLDQSGTIIFVRREGGGPFNKKTG